MADAWTAEHKGEFTRMWDDPRGLHGLQSYVQRSDDINKWLRFGSLTVAEHLQTPEYKAKIARWIDDLDDVFRDSSVPLDEDVAVVRGILPHKPGNVYSVSPEGFDPGEYFRVGETYTDAGFMSTTSDAAIAARFTGRKNEGENWFMDVEVPAGTNVVPINNDRGEHEVLLNRGTSYEVVSVDAAKRRVRVRVVPTPPDAKPEPAVDAPAAKPETWNTPEAQAELKKTNRSQTMMLKKLAAKFGIEGFESTGELGSLPMTPANVEALRKMLDSPQMTPGYRTTLSTLIPNESAGPAAKLSSTQWSVLHNIVKWKNSDAFEGEFVPGKVFKPTQADLDRIAKYADDYAAQFGDKALPPTSLRSLLKKFGYKPSESAAPVNKLTAADLKPVDLADVDPESAPEFVRGYIATRDASAALLKKNADASPQWDRILKEAGRILRADYEGYAPRVAVSPETLSRVLDDGRLRNAHETGAFDDEYMTRRRWVEDNVLGVPAGTPEDQRPVYGFYGKPTSATAGLYGAVTLRLKDSAKDRITATHGDSIASLARPVPFAEFHKLKGDKLLESSDVSGMWQAAKEGAKAGKDRDTIARDMAKATGYDEIQIYGGVTTDDFEAAEFFLPAVWELAKTDPKGARELMDAMDEARRRARARGLRVVTSYGDDFDDAEYARRSAQLDKMAG